MKFKDKLRELRKHVGLTQEELAKRSGVPVYTIRGHEQGQRLPSWVIFMRLADGLGVSADNFRDCDEVKDAHKTSKRKRKR